MCGLCGFFAYGNNPLPNRDVMHSVRDSMRNRGPDGSGEWLSDDNQVWLGHRRLAIIDLSNAGSQPMSSTDGGVVITFNGEIYNYKVLRSELEAAGSRFRSNSDTEVILELYRVFGTGFVPKLRGMFAFAIWDATAGRLLLARDPYGIKPIYYSDTSGVFSFASSVKALMQDGRLSRAADPAGLAGFFVFGSVPEPWTMYASVRLLPAGSTLVVDNRGAGSVSHYCRIEHLIAEAEVESIETAARGNSETNAHVFRDAMLDAVKHHLVADVPVGAFLSAGVDSSALVGLMRDAGQSRIQTITLTYDEFNGTAFNEAPLAEMVARHYGTEHSTRRVSAAEFHDDLPRILAAMDQPSIDGVNMWFVSKAASELGLKVAISGVGGDELLGGYPSFQSVPQWERALRVPSRIGGLAGLVSRAVRAVTAMGGNVHPKYAGLLRYGGSVPGLYLLQRGLFLPFELQDFTADPAFLKSGVEQLDPVGLLTKNIENGPNTMFGRISSLESSFYMRNQLLRDTDWASMAHSLEVRTPLVDHVLLRKSMPYMVTANRPSGKALLASAPSKPIPDAIANRPKSGFGIPVETWLRQTKSEHFGARDDHRHFSRNWALSVAEWQQSQSQVTRRQIDVA
jgi:asparagine synthase (glutamine-hydrolysing)